MLFVIQVIFKHPLKILVALRLDVLSKNIKNLLDHLVLDLSSASTPLALFALLTHSRPFALKAINRLSVIDSLLFVLLDLNNLAVHFSILTNNVLLDALLLSVYLGIAAYLVNIFGFCRLRSRLIHLNRLGINTHVLGLQLLGSTCHVLLLNQIFSLRFLVDHL
jgi:hypothetical protein